MNHRPRKRFGQHFLRDESVISEIIAAVAPQPDDTIVEIGPGTGAITMPLAARCGHLHVVELDRDLAATLARRTGLGDRLVIHNEDALRFDFCALQENCDSAPRLRITGNLPYNISTPLLFHLIGHVSCIEDMHFMLQREVVQRMAATAGQRSYGRLSIMLAQHYIVESLFDIDPQAFSPPPKVHSSFVRLTPVTAPPFHVIDQDMFSKTVAQAFSMRRKTLRNALRGLVDADDFERLEIDSRARPETLAPAAFAALANAACESGRGHAV